MKRLTGVRFLLCAALCACLAHAPAPARKQEGEAGQQQGRAAALRPVMSRMKWGYIDGTGKLVIEAKYDWESYFSEGVAVVRTVFLNEAAAKHVPEGNFISTPVEGMKWEIIDDSGKTLVTLPEGRAYEESMFSEGLAPFSVWEYGKGGVYGFMDKGGNVVIEPRFRSRAFFREGLAGVCNFSGKCGFIDRTGAYVVRPRYREVVPFHEGLAAVSPDGEVAGFVNKSGETVIEPQFRMNGDFRFSEGLAAAAFAGSNRYGYIDKLGHFRIEPRFEAAGPFSEGLAPVMTGGKFGYIDRGGKFVVEPQFTIAAPFREGLAGASTCANTQRPASTADGAEPEPCAQTGFVDKTGRFVITRVDPAGGVGFRDGVAQVFVGGYRTYIDRAGKILWQMKPDDPEAAP